MARITAPFCAAVVENTGAANAAFEGDGLPLPLHEVAEIAILSVRATIAAVFSITSRQLNDTSCVFNNIRELLPRLSCRSFVFIDILALFRRFSMSTRFHSKVQSTPGPRSPTTPTPSSSEEGSREFPSLDKEGSWVVDSVGRPFVFIDILALFPGIRSADLQVGMSAEQEC